MPDNPTTDLGETLTLAVLRFTTTADLSLAARNAHLTTHIDREAQHLVARLDAEVAAEHLPPRSFTVYVPDPRWATWWDHLKATGAHRWWGRAVARRWPPRTVDTRVRCDVDVRSYWLYPDTPLPRSGLGRPVVYTNTTWNPGGPA
jgi:hypothetical protein